MKQSKNYKVGNFIMQYQGYGNGFKLGKISKVSEKPPQKCGGFLFAKTFDRLLVRL